MIDKLRALKDKYQLLEEQLSDPEITGDMKRYMKISKEYKDLQPFVKAHDEYKQMLDNIAECREIISEGDDPDFVEMAKDDLKELETKIGSFEEELKVMLIPKDPEDEKNVTIEIRSGAGGDEAAIFAGDMLRVYERFIDRQGWRR